MTDTTEPNITINSRYIEERAWLEFIGECPSAEDIARPMVEAMNKLAEIAEHAENLEFGVDFADPWMTARAETVVQNLREAMRLVEGAARLTAPLGQERAVESAAMRLMASIANVGNLRPAQASWEEIHSRLGIDMHAAGCRPLGWAAANGVEYAG